jgi:uncharacterized protein (TIGR02246 family)
MSTNSEANTSVDKAAIDRLREAHVAALNAGDADSWAACFAGDGVQMPPNFGTNAGKAAIEGWSKGFLGLFSCKFNLSVDEVQVASDWAFERGRYDITLSPRSGGGSMDDNGKYITIYQRQPDGGWKIARDIWNSDRPLPGTK